MNLTLGLHSSCFAVANKVKYENQLMSSRNGHSLYFSLSKSLCLMSSGHNYGSRRKVRSQMTL